MVEGFGCQTEPYRAEVIAEPISEIVVGSTVTMMRNSAMISTRFGYLSTIVLNLRPPSVYTDLVNGAEFIERARRYAKKTGQDFRVNVKRGKGSHGILYIGNRLTTVQKGELKPGTFRSMLKQLDIQKEDF